MKPFGMPFLMCLAWCLIGTTCASTDSAMRLGYFVAGDCPYCMISGIIASSIDAAMAKRFTILPLKGINQLCWFAALPDKPGQKPACHRRRGRSLSGTT